MMTAISKGFLPPAIISLVLTAASHGDTTFLTNNTSPKTLAPDEGDGAPLAGIGASDVTALTLSADDGGSALNLTTVSVVDQNGATTLGMDGDSLGVNNDKWGVDQVWTFSFDQARSLKDISLSDANTVQDRLTISSTAWGSDTVVDGGNWTFTTDGTVGTITTAVIPGSPTIFDFDASGLSSVPANTTITIAHLSGGGGVQLHSFTVGTVVLDPDPPTPDPMTWESEPAAIGETSITMTATTAIDPSGVQYYFTETSGAGNDSGWQTSPTYIDTGLSPNTTYTYTVKARDALGLHETGASGAVAATTDPAAPPTPNPMTWASVPTATSESIITMTATTASDPSGVQYQFVRRLGLGGSVEFTSAWQDSPEYTDTGLNPGTEYSYTVAARDSLGNTTDPSGEEAATTDPADVTPPSPSTMTFSTAPIAITPTSITMTATTATDPYGVEYFFDETSGNPGGSDSGWQDSPTYLDTGLDPNTEYTYTVIARDKSLAQNPTTASSPASATTHPSTGIGTLLIGGFGGTSATAIQSATISNVDVTLTSSEVPGVPTDGNAQMDGILWGNSALDVEAPSISNTQDPGRAAVIQEGTGTSWTLVLTVTNNGADELSLEGLHFKTKKDINNQGPNYCTIAYASGNLGAPASIIMAIPNGAGNGFDIPLAGFLADTTLAGGETATFTWTPGPPEDPAGNTGFRLDNFALSGSVAGGSPAFNTWAARDGASGVTFEGDANGDGVIDGLAFLLGADNPNVNATGLLPSSDENGGDLVMSFDCLAAAARGTAVLTLGWDGDLAGSWLGVPVPGAVGAPNPIVEANGTGSVSFVATDGGTNTSGDPLIAIEATISDATQSAGGKLFGRLEGAESTP
ncbi:hypothetical protein [Haloferula sp. A504]|uniref:hypothetical protein n=1 Tax=Haloferula sp. A504 TaxID=3373601 RepID=UPI0031BD534D|nr:fibronectin type III domain-containing protein [Verrucomicrobiaceae bacterium E54]